MQKSSPTSIITRLTGWYALSVFLLVLVVTASLYVSLNKILTKEDNGILLDRIEAIRSIIQNNDNPMVAIRQRVDFEWASRHAEQIYVKLVSPSGKVLVQSPSLPPAINDVFITNSAPHSIVTSTYASMSSVISSRDPDLNGATAYVALDLSKEQKILGYFKTSTLTILIFATIVCAFIGIRMARAFFAPVQNIIDKARHIRASNIHERIDEVGLPRELATLAGTINEMLDRLEDSFSRLSRFSADLAHELRTPINNMRGEIEVSLTKTGVNGQQDEILASVMEETGRISNIIDSLLFLAKAENPELQLKKESVDLGNEVGNILDFFEAWASESQVKFRVSIPKGLNLPADRTLLQRVLSNVISNAVKYTKKSGLVTIEAHEEGESVVVKVADTGTGIAETDLPHVFERFYRGDPSRTSRAETYGTGLGLTIVKSIMTLHRGTVSLESQVGKGTIVTLVFPKKSSLSAPEV